jgi:dynein heavy chain
MNPDYAGRNQLPDNFKEIYRPISLIVPDYSSISKILLFSYGF